MKKGTRTMVAAAALATSTGVAGAAGGSTSSALVGTWLHEDGGRTTEYRIEAVGNDGSVRGVVCTARAGHHIWGLRLEGVATVTDGGRGLKVRHPSANDDVKVGRGDTLDIMTRGADNSTWKPQVQRFERSDTTRCAHRLLAAPATQREAAGTAGTGSIAGTWKGRHGVAKASELTISAVGEDHVEGRLCMAMPAGDIYVFDLHESGPNEAVYTPKNETLRVRNEANPREMVRMRFKRTAKDRLRHNITWWDRNSGKKTGERTRSWKRGRDAEGCLSRTSARVASLEGTWRTKGGAGPATTIKITSDHGADRVEGFVCTKHEDGRVEAARFGGDAKGRVRSRARTVEIVVPGETWETTRALTSDPTRPGTLDYAYARDGDAEGEGGGAPTTLRRTKRKTCADALRTPAQVPPPTGAGEAPKGPGGEWTATDAQSGAIFEARIESLRRRRSAVGLVCEATADGSIRWWNLNHPKVRARYDGKSTVQWSQKTGSGEIERETAHRLVLTEVQGREYLSHIAQATGAPTRTTVMSRGRAEGGCLAQIAPQRGARRGADRRRAGQQVGNGR